MVWERSWRPVSPLTGLSTLSEQATWLIRLSRAPYYDEQLTQGLDVALACGAFGQSVVVVLEGLAVGVLKANQLAPTGEANLFKQLSAMPLYDIERIYCLANDDDNDVTEFDASHTHAMEGLAIETITTERWYQLVANAKHVLNF